MAETLLIDPLGRRIVLHRHTWYGHILKRHRDMKTLRRSVENAVRAPLAICHSSSSADCRVYFGRAPAPGIMVAVVADVVAGVVKTAYRAARVKGAQEWLPPTP